MMVGRTHSDGARVSLGQSMGGYAALYEERARIVAADHASDPRACAVKIASARAAADSSTAPRILSICATVASMAFTFALVFAIQLLSSYGNAAIGAAALACLFPAALLLVLLIMIVVVGRANVRDKKIANLDAMIYERIVAEERERRRAVDFEGLSNISHGRIKGNAG